VGALYRDVGSVAPAWINGARASERIPRLAHRGWARVERSGQLADRRQASADGKGSGPYEATDRGGNSTSAPVGDVTSEILY
jgi:hypothetical protein